MSSTNEFISNKVTLFLKYKCFILPQPLFVPTIPILVFPMDVSLLLCFSPITSMPTKLFFPFRFLLSSSLPQFHHRSSSVLVSGTSSSSMQMMLIFGVNSAFFYISFS